jgi:hypothetical protein
LQPKKQRLLNLPGQKTLFNFSLSNSKDDNNNPVDTNTNTAIDKSTNNGDDINPFRFHYFYCFEFHFQGHYARVNVIAIIGTFVNGSICICINWIVIIIFTITKRKVK